MGYGTADLVLNLLIVLSMGGVLLHFCRMDGAWSAGRIRKAFRYFTVQSNVLCAAAALLTCLAPEAEWVRLLKVAGTAAVTVTMVTVLVFLGPIYGYKPLLSGTDLIMHLVNPLLALLSFCVFERRGLRFGQALVGLVPTVLYGALYFYQLFRAPPDKAWEDFYAFNRGGKWPLSAAVMLTGTFLICMGLLAVQNL